MDEQVKKILEERLKEKLWRFTPEFREKMSNTSLEIDAIRNFYNTYSSFFRDKRIIRGRILASKATTIEEMLEALEICVSETSKYNSKVKK